MILVREQTAARVNAEVYLCPLDAESLITLALGEEVQRQHHTGNLDRLAQTEVGTTSRARRQVGPQHLHQCVDGECGSRNLHTISF